MYCLRCGTETEKDQVFCQKCTENMDRHPVKPGTPIKIPVRNTNTSGKKPNRKKNISAEEMVSRLRVRNRTVIALWLTSLVLLGVMTFLYIREIKKPNVAPTPTKPITGAFAEWEIEI